MNTILPLLKKLLLESRWSFGLTVAAMFGWGVLAAWSAQFTERIMGSDELTQMDQMNMGRVRFLGGPAMDLSTTALEVCQWNHPIPILIVLGWALARGSGAVSGEIERGTIDVTLSRPVPRWAYLFSQIAFAIAGLIALIAALILGELVGNVLYTLKTPVELLTLLKPGAIVLTTGLAILGYTLPFSAMDISRWRPALASGGLTLAGLVAMGLAQMLPKQWRWIENLSVYQYYAPVMAAITGEGLGANTAVLSSVFAVGTALAFWLFLRRDLPSNS